MNFPLLAALAAIIFAQIIKYPIAKLTKDKKASLDLITSTGGMPSSHSAAVSSLTTALILEYGFSSPYVAISTVFGIIIMFDSMGVRRQSGEQGIILDILARSFFRQQQQKKLEVPENHDNPVILDYDKEEYDKMVINRYLGHKPSEVIVGTFTGGFVAIVLRIILF